MASAPIRVIDVQGIEWLIDEVFSPAISIGEKLAGAPPAAVDRVFWYECCELLSQFWNGLHHAQAWEARRPDENGLWRITLFPPDVAAELRTLQAIVKKAAGLVVELGSAGADAPCELTDSTGIGRRAMEAVAKHYAASDLVAIGRRGLEAVARHEPPKAALLEWLNANDPDKNPCLPSAKRTTAVRPDAIRALVDEAYQRAYRRDLLPPAPKGDAERDLVVLRRWLASKSSPAVKPGESEGNGRAGSAPEKPQAGKTSKPKRGRPADTNAKEDRRVYEAWKTGQYKKHADCDQGLGLPAGDTYAACERHRKRVERRNSAAGQNSRQPCQ